MAQPHRTIHIDDEVFALLQRHSEPLVEVHGPSGAMLPELRGRLAGPS
ncbi:hypothetical protein ACWGB8_11200 [Kitasatospora sp. NPDC054939]